MAKEGNWSDRPEVSAELATKYRAAVARVVYLAQDRLDLGVAAVELAKTTFRERVTTNASNVLHDTCMVTLTTSLVSSSGRHEHSCFDHRCRLGHVPRITLIEFRRDSATGESSYRRVELCSTTHRTKF